MDDFIKGTQVKCDEPGCGWYKNIEPSEMGDWHNTPCPECGNGVIVNDEEMSVWYTMLSMLHMAKAAYPDKKADGYIHVNTEALRNK